MALFLVQTGRSPRVFKFDGDAAAVYGDFAAIYGDCASVLASVGAVYGGGANSDGGSGDTRA
eukprot:1410088-Rhodomonas_salina.1